MLKRAAPEPGDLQHRDHLRPLPRWSRLRRSSSRTGKATTFLTLASLLSTGTAVVALHHHTLGFPPQRERPAERNSFEIFAEQPELPVLRDMKSSPLVVASRAVARIDDAQDRQGAQLVPPPQTPTLAGGLTSRTAVLPAPFVPTTSPITVVLQKPTQQAIAKSATATTPPVIWAALVPPTLVRTQEPGPVQRAWSPAPEPDLDPVPVAIHRPAVTRVADAPRTFAPRSSPNVSGISVDQKAPPAGLSVRTVVGSLLRRSQSAGRSGAQQSRPTPSQWKLPVSLSPTE